MCKDYRNILTTSFYRRNNVVLIAKELLGKTIVTNIDGLICKGMIVETEAYSGIGDKACHAKDGRRTKRTEVMYHEGGRAYVYLCYGIHHLFNIVTNEEDKADAVLIRALEPVQGHDVMRIRLNSSNQKLTNGPGILSKSMGITTKYTGVELNGGDIWIEDAAMVNPEGIVTTTRVGVDYAEEDALLPWRFYLKGNPWVSRF